MGGVASCNDLDGLQGCATRPNHQACMAVRGGEIGGAGGARVPSLFIVTTPSGTLTFEWLSLPLAVHELSDHAPLFDGTI